MPRVKLTKTVIDALPTPSNDIVYWDTGCREALETWGAHVSRITGNTFEIDALRKVA